MEVKDIFELRKQGKIEEAYAAIRPMYAEHKGHYTTLGMFWVGVDVMFLRFKDRKLEEAYKIFRSLLRIYPSIDDKDKAGQRAILRAALLVADYHPGFLLLDFMLSWDIRKLTEEDWQVKRVNDHLVPALAMRIMSRIFKEVEAKGDIDTALKATPLLAEALKHAPLNMNYQRYKAIIYRIMGEKEEAIKIYKGLLQKHRQAYLYQELSELIDNEKLKLALLLRALIAQRDDKFKQKLRFKIASGLFRYDKSRAKYELEHCVATRKRMGYAITFEMQNLLATLEEEQAVSDIDQKSFYKRVERFVDGWLQPRDK